MVSLSLYMPWGESRGGAGTTLTDYGFDGQRSMEGSIGLQYFNARWYDSSLGRWTQPDSIVPQASQGVQAWDRYEFVNNRPTHYNDPNGHCVDPDMCPGMPPDPSQPTFNPSPTPVPEPYVMHPTATPGLTCGTPTPPDVLFNPAPTFTPTFTPPPTARPNPTNSPEQNAKEIETVGGVIDVGEKANLFHVPGGLGFAIDAYAQNVRDEGKGYSQMQELARSGIMGIEGQVNAGVSGAAATAVGVVGSPTTIADVAVIASTYFLVNAIISVGADSLNSNVVFPAIDKNIP